MFGCALRLGAQILFPGMLGCAGVCLGVLGVLTQNMKKHIRASCESKVRVRWTVTVNVIAKNVFFLELSSLFVRKVSESEVKSES